MSKPEETPIEYITRDLKDYCGRLRDDIKQKLDASIKPMEGSYEERQRAFTAHLDWLTHKDGLQGTCWMPLPDLYSNVRLYENDVVAEATVSGKVIYGVH